MSEKFRFCTDSNRTDELYRLLNTIHEMRDIESDLGFIREGFDICGFESKSDVLLLKEIALALELIRPAGGNSEHLYFLTLEGHALFASENEHQIKEEMNGLLSFIIEID